jgi:hypothetical protein
MIISYLTNIVKQSFKKILYRKTPLKLPWATTGSPPNKIYLRGFFSYPFFRLNNEKMVGKKPLINKLCYLDRPADWPIGLRVVAHNDY